jgi:hypothetical protein
MPKRDQVAQALGLVVPPNFVCEGFRSIVNQNFPTDANKKAKI